MLSTNNEELHTIVRDEKDRQEQNKQSAKAMTFHFELNQLARTRGNRRASTTAIELECHNTLSNTFGQSNDGSYSMDDCRCDDIDMPQRKQQQRRASAKYYTKNKEAIKEKRRMRYWVGILTKIAERNNSGNESTTNEDQDMTQKDSIEMEEEMIKEGRQRVQRRNSNPKETVFVMESGKPRQRGGVINGEEYSQGQQEEEPRHTVNQEHPSSSNGNGSAVHFHEQLNAIISNDNVERRDDLVLSLKPILEAMLTRMIELEQQ